MENPNTNTNPGTTGTGVPLQRLVSLLVEELTKEAKWARNRVMVDGKWDNSKAEVLDAVVSAVRAVEVRMSESQAVGIPQDAVCTRELRQAGKPYPKTCPTCGLSKVCPKQTNDGS